MRKRSWLVLAVVGGICGAMGVLRVLKRDEVSVLFALPDGYQGAFVISCLPTRGDEVVPANGQLVLRIPKSGILGIRDCRVLERFHTSSAQYENGTRIPYYQMGISGDGKDSVVLCSIMANDRGEVWYYVGPIAKVEHFSAHPDELALPH